MKGLKMEAFKKYFPAIAVLFIPFGFLSFGMIHEGQQLALVAVTLCILACQIQNKWVTLFLVYVFSWLIFMLIYRLLVPVPENIIPEAFGEYGFFICGTALYLCFSKTTIRKTWFYNIICVSAIIQCGLACSQLLGFDIIIYLLSKFTFAISELATKTATGTMANPNFLGAYLAISLPFFFRRKWFYFIPLIAFILIMTKTAGAIIPAMIGCAYYFSNYWRDLNKKLRIRSAFYIIVLIAGAIIAKHESMFVRFSFWQDVLDKLINSPVNLAVGFGIGANWGRSFPMHNEWLTIIFQYGLVGFGLVLAYFLTAYRGNKILFTALIISGINMTVNYPLHLAPSAFLIIMIAGLAEREKEYGR